MRYSHLALCSVVIYFFSGCGAIKPLIEVDYHTNDSTKFMILPLNLAAPKEKSSILASFIYNDKANGKKLITCIIQQENSHAKLGVTHAEIIGDHHNYHASTFDYLPSANIGKERYLHTYSFYLPDLDFDNMMKQQNIQLKINNLTYHSKGKKWSKIGAKIKSMQLMDHLSNE